MAFARNVWDQLKNTTADDLIKALEKDGWARDGGRGAKMGFFKSVGGQRLRVVIHYHPSKTFGSRLLQGLIDDIGWSEDDLKRLKLIKK